MWGTTLVTMDAYKKEKLTFAKAMAKSEHGEKMKKYLYFTLSKSHVRNQPLRRLISHVFTSSQLSAQEGI
jgi:hypothetical protein